MFLKTGELKKLMKASLKTQGLAIGFIETDLGSYYLAYSDFWGLKVDEDAAANRFKAAIMELVGEIPERGSCHAYQIDPDTGITYSSIWDYPDPYMDWKRAKDSAKETPLILSIWPHEYRVYQREGGKGYLAVSRAWTDHMLSPKELTDIESMPGPPSLRRIGEDMDILYFKNQTTIYWVCSANPGEKSREVLFPRLRELDFSEEDWLWKGREERGAGEAGDSEPEEGGLPY